MPQFPDSVAGRNDCIAQYRALNAAAATENRQLAAEEVAWRTGAPIEAVIPVPPRALPGLPNNAARDAFIDALIDDYEATQEENWNRRRRKSAWLNGIDPDAVADRRFVRPTHPFRGG